VVEGVDDVLLWQTIERTIYEDKDFREKSMSAIHRRLDGILHDKRFSSRITSSKKNWLDVPYEIVVAGLLDRFAE
jgi:hypothetical protein